jgi:predicted component of type VI protein secretion system
VKPKPDAKQLEHAAAALRVEHQPRQLNHEPRVSIADERAVVEAAHRRNNQAMRADLQKALTNITTEVAYIEAYLGRVAPGDHRDAVRFAHRAIAKLNRVLDK